MTTGIYQIRNKQNNKIYVGSSRNIAKRKRSHYSLLRRDEHPNTHLQAAWNHYGESNFIFEILLACDEECLLDKEREILQESGCLNRETGYNKSTEPTAPMAGLKHSQESIEKMRLAKLGDKNSFYNKTHTEETKRKISEAKTGVALSPEHKEKVLRTALKAGEENRNAILTEKQVLEIRELAAVHYEKKKSYYGLFTKLAKVYGVNRTTISKIVYNITWKGDTND